MEIKGIKYISPCLDGSGYANAARGNILALHKLGIPLTLSPISFEEVRPDLGKHGDTINSLIDKDINYNIVIIHTTPEFWEKYNEPGKVNIGYTIWETSRLHKDWSGYINNNVDKVLVGCTWNIEVFRNSGVTVPIGVVPHGIDASVFDNADPYNVSGISDDTFIFYSIFQWTERKNPLAMIKAYWHAFQNDEDVALVLKTYRSNYDDRERDAIRTTIKRVKEVTPFPKYPKIYLISDMLTDNEIYGLHKRGDCYMSFDRGEGFGLTPFAAGACGNPIVVTGYGGVTEYANEDNSYLINHTLAPVFGKYMPFTVVTLCRNSSNCWKPLTNNVEGNQQRSLLKERSTTSALCT
jgi:glycosyltransferase involved in cell wall biosynthesis